MKVSVDEATAVWQQLEKDPIYTLQNIRIWIQTKCIAEAPTIWRYATAHRHEQSSHFLVVICTSLQLLIRDVTNLLHSFGKLREKQVPPTSRTCRKTQGEQKRKWREVRLSNCSHWWDDNSSDIMQNQWHIKATTTSYHVSLTADYCFQCLQWTLDEVHTENSIPALEHQTWPRLYGHWLFRFFLTWLCMPFWMKEKGRVCIRNYCSAISNFLIPSTPKEASILQES